MSKRELGSATAPAASWIYNPWLDLIVGCGAWSLPLLALTYFTFGSSALGWSVAFYALALFLNYPHYMATLYRAYRNQEDFDKYRVFTVHITALMIATLVLSHLWLRALPLIFTLYVTWSPWHYSGQNYGLFMMFARRAGVQPSNLDKHLLHTTFFVSYAILFLSFNTGPSRDPLFLSLGFPGKAAAIAVGVLTLIYVSCAALGLSRLSEQVGWRPLIPSLTLFSTQFVWFLLPTVLSMGEGLGIPQSRYSTGVLAVMHSAQYLWITSYYARRESMALDVKTWRPFAYFGVLVAGGIALFVPGPWIASHVFHLDFTSSFLIFTALVNIHHFILDGAIWKLRDGRIAALLLNSRETVSNTARETGEAIWGVIRWLVGESSAARRFRYSAAAVLLAWAMLDQVHYYLALHTDDLSDLQHAVALASYDTSVQMRLARKEFEAGNPEEGAGSWRRAIQANPLDPAPRHLLLQYLVGQRRYREAYSLTRESLKYLPNDSDLLVDQGILAKQFGDGMTAMTSWRQATRVNPGQSSAHLYLAGELQQQGNFAEAASQYLIFLNRVSKLTAEQKPSAATVVGAALKLAECQEQMGKLDDAEKAYEIARHVAAQSGENRLLSVGSIHEASLETKKGKITEALKLYQEALRVDARTEDREGEAADWDDYAEFLRSQAFPERLVYACLIRSELLLKASNDDSKLKTVSQRRSAMEKTAADWASVRQNPDAAWKEALALTR